MNYTEKKAQTIRKVICLIQEYIIQPSIVDMKQNNFQTYELHMKELFPDFEKIYPALFGIIINSEDSSMINIILNGLIKESRGEITSAEREEEVGKGVMDAIQYHNEVAINKVQETMEKNEKDLRDKGIKNLGQYTK
jgi:hypothetical protein